MPDLVVSIVLELTPAAAFDMLVAELRTALLRHGLTLEPGGRGRILDGDHEAGTVVAWRPGTGASLRWRAASWEQKAPTKLDLTFAKVKGGTRVTLTHRRWGKAVGGKAELAGWFAGEVMAPLLRATAPSGLGEWITDRRARRPWGAQARDTYRDPIFHYPNFRAILEELALTERDVLLEVACGGGAFLRLALESGCRASALDHSPEMVALARDVNRAAVAAGRLDVREGDAAALPFANATFTCAVMTGVLGFLADPVRVLTEIRRTLKPGGRCVVLGTDPELKGTPGAPEPIASRLTFYDSPALEALGRRAGFEDVRVIRRDLEQYAREAGVPEYALPLFRARPGGGARFLLARRA